MGMVPDRAGHPGRRVDEWGGTVSPAKLAENARAKGMVESDKAASEAAGAKFAKIDAYKLSPEGMAAANKREHTRVANLGANSVEGQTGRGGYSMSVGKRPSRRQG